MSDGIACRFIVLCYGSWTEEKGSLVKAAAEESREGSGGGAGSYSILVAAPVECRRRCRSLLL